MIASQFTQGFQPMSRSAGGNVPHTRLVMEEGEIQREGTAEITNDPRFFAENVIEKRLAAFEALAVITGIMAEESLKQTFELSKEFAWTGPLLVISILQLIGFFIMVFVAFMDLVACAVLSLQLFFTIRLFTAGPTGFDKASRFYTDDRMWRWRERAIFCVKWSIVMFVLSTGFMLCVKFYVEGAPEVEEETRRQHTSEYHGHQILAAVVFVVFLVLSYILAWLGIEHTKVFNESYSSVELCSPLMMTTSARH
eukprot:gb/GFBE01069274.1/.p1 GENE.gb/GFBE01069274.1/~~gb/GFBE01069274.1/.p1  ORF type:complete len:253 (+),score=72.46 gb/GFBE01069274.1/:1-759(+)